MKTFRAVLLMITLFGTLAGCKLSTVTRTEKPVTSPIIESPVAIATTELSRSESLPSNTPTQPEPTRKATNTPIPPTATPTLFPEYQTHFVKDESGAIMINVPTLWTDQRTLPWVDDKGKEIGTTLIVATDVDKFLILEAEGVAISVSKRLPIGYIELLDGEVHNYLGICDDTYHTRWDINTDTHRGKEAVLNCHGSSYEWLSIMTMVNKADPSAYIVRLVGFDMIPIFGEDFRDMLRQFEIEPSLLP